MQACATGEHIKEATITHRKAGKGQQEFLIVKMNDVIITSVTHGGSGGDGALGEREPRVRQGRRRIQAAEGRRVARCRHPLQVRPQGPEGRLSGFRMTQVSTGTASSSATTRPAGAGDMFLMVKGAKHGAIKGEVAGRQAQGRDRGPELVVGHAGQAVAGRRRRTGKATIRELRIVKRVDKASTALMGALAHERGDQGRPCSRCARPARASSST